MKADYTPGAASPCTVFEPGQISGSLSDHMERFRFPRHEFPVESMRRREIEIDRAYNSRSVFIVYFSPHDYHTLIATARIIIRERPGEKLPIEFGEVVSISENSSTAPVGPLKVGMPIRVSAGPENLPACEIGGLRAAEVDHTSGITLRLRYHALSTVLNTCFEQCIMRHIHVAFLTCIGTPNVLGIYRDRFKFKEIAEINYGSGIQWKALWRYAGSDTGTAIPAITGNKGNYNK